MLQELKSLCEYQQHPTFVFMNGLALQKTTWGRMVLSKLKDRSAYNSKIDGHNLSATLPSTSATSTAGTRRLQAQPKWLSFLRVRCEFAPVEGIKALNWVSKQSGWKSKSPLLLFSTSRECCSRLRSNGVQTQPQSILCS